MNAVGPNWQRLAILGVCASAAVFLAGSAWQVVGVLAPVLGLFFGGWLLSCVLEPLVGQITLHTRASRSGAVLAAYLSVVIALGIVWIVAAPTLALQLTTSVTNLPGQVEAASQRIVAVQGIASTWLAQHGVPVQLDLVSTRSFETFARESAATSPLTAIQALTGALGSAGIMLLLSVFFLAGGHQLADQVISGFGDRAAPDIKFVLTAIHDAFESFARAQLIQAILFGGAVWVCLAVAQVESAPLVGAVAGALLLVPVVGAALALVLPLAAVVVWNPSATLAVGIGLVLLQQVVLNVVGPRLMSKQLGLPPLLIFFGVLAGGQVGGFWGAVFGIPALAALVACLGYFRPRWSHPG